MADGVAVCDARGQFVVWNPGADAIIKMGAADVATEAWADHYGLFLPDKATPVPHDQVPLVRAINGEEVDGASVFVRHAAAPEGVWLDVNARPLGLAGGGAVAVFRDVTEQRKLQEQLMVSDRMASVGTLASGVAHEINNPLASVMANLHLAVHGIADLAARLGASTELDELREELDDAAHAAERIRNIVRDLRIFSRSERETTEPVDVQRVMESTLRMAWNELRHRARLVKTYGKVAPVEASESRLGQVFLNLVVNAAQAIPEGRTDANEIRISTRTGDDGRVIVEIADTGPGIPPNVLKQLFTPFFTTKPVGVGTGLGLSICERIVTGFGGTIEVESELGKGTVFRVALLAARSTEAQEAPEPTRSSSATRRGRILVVDDEPAIAKAVQRTLSREHEVVVLESAVTALERIRAGERFDVILCDLMMPQMTGMDLHAALLQDEPSTKRTGVDATSAQ
jgi:signal transduction histidine kinase